MGYKSNVLVGVTVSFLVLLSGCGQHQKDSQSTSQVKSSSSQSTDTAQKEAKKSSSSTNDKSSSSSTSSTSSSVLDSSSSSVSTASSISSSSTELSTTQLNAWAWKHFTNQYGANDPVNYNFVNSTDNAGLGQVYIGPKTESTYENTAWFRINSSNQLEEMSSARSGWYVVADHYME